MLLSNAKSNTIRCVKPQAVYGICAIVDLMHPGAHLMRNSEDPAGFSLLTMGGAAGTINNHTPINYYLIQVISRTADVFREAMLNIYYKALKLRSQRSPLNWKKFGTFINTVLPEVNVLHPWPEQWFDVK